MTLLHCKSSLSSYLFILTWLTISVDSLDMSMTILLLEQPLSSSKLRRAWTYRPCLSSFSFLSRSSIICVNFCSFSELLMMLMNSSRRKRPDREGK